MSKKEQTLEEILEHLWHALKVKDLTVKEVLAVLSGKLKLALLILLSLCTLISLPGITVIFGSLISYVGIRMLFRKGLWLPKKILKLKVHNAFLKKVVRKGLWFIKKIKVLTHPRFGFVLNNSFMKIFNRVLIVLIGLVIAFLPLPFTAFVAGASVFLISMGLIEKDGLFVILGYLVCILIVVVSFDMVKII